MTRSAIGRLSVLVTAVVIVASCARATPERQVIDAAAEALGGTAAITAARTITMEGGGMNGAMGGERHPG